MQVLYVHEIQLSACIFDTYYWVHVYVYYVVHSILFILSYIHTLYT